MNAIKPIYFDRETGQFRQAQSGDTLDIPVLGIIADSYITLAIDVLPNTCFAVLDDIAYPINSKNLPNLVNRDVPWVDGVILEGGTRGQKVKVVMRHGELVHTNTVLPIGTILYLSSNSTLKSTIPVKPLDDYYVIVGRYSTTNSFIFDPQPPKDLSASSGGIPETAGHGDEALFVSPDGSGVLFRKVRASDIAPDFNCSISPVISLLEIGQSITNPVFNASYNEQVLEATLKNNESLSTIYVTGTTFNLPGTLVKNSISSISFTLAATSVSGYNDTATTSISWSHRSYWGTGIKGSDLNTFIKGLQNSSLSSSKVKQFTVNAINGDRIYYAIPTVFGTPIFYVGGFEGGFRLVSNNIIVTNNYGINIQYSLYESEQVNLGNTTVYAN